MADNALNIINQIAAQESQDHQSVAQTVGQAKVAQEQDGYQQQISANQPPPARPGGFWHGVAQVGEGLYSGAVHGVTEMADSAEQLNAWANDHGLGSLNLLNYFIPTPDGQQAQADIQASRRFANAITPTIDTTAGRLAQGIGQFTVAMLPADRVLGAAGLAGGFARTVLAGGIAQGAAFDPTQARLSSLIDQYPELRNPVTEFMQTHPGDPAAEARLRSTLEGLVEGAGAEGVIGAFGHALRFLRGAQGAAEVTGALRDVKPTEIGGASAPAETPRAPAPQPWVPATITSADTTHPGGNLTGTEGQLADAEQGTRAAPKEGNVDGVAAELSESAHPQADVSGTFDPQKAASSVMQLDPAAAENLRGYFADGRYADAANAILERTHQNIDWDALSDGANLKGTFAALEANLGDSIRAAHGVAPVTQDSIVQAARDLGARTPEQVGQLTQSLMADTTADGGLAARITAGYGMMLSSARRLKALAGVAHALNPDTVEGKQALLEFQKALEMHAAIVGQVRRSSQEIGRALWAHRALKASAEASLDHLGEVTATNLGAGAVRKFAESIATGDGGKDLATLANVTDKVGGNRLVNVIKEIALNGMLSGPKTQLTNLAGNGLNLLIKNAERFLAGTIGSVRGVMMPTTEHATVRAAVAHTIGTLAGIRDALPIAGETLLHEPEVWPSSGRPVSRAIFVHTDGMTGAKLTAAKALNVTGQVIRYPGRLMGTVDTLNAAAGERGDLFAGSYLQAAREADASGLKGAERSAWMQQRMAELRANPTEELAEHAKDAGLYQSFQEDTRTKLGQSITNLMSNHPLVKLIVSPFIHRPGNILRQGLMDYTPLGLLTKATRATLAGKNADTDQAIARMVMGSSALMYGYHLAESGRITGASLGARNTAELSDIPPNSMRLGGKWYAYDRLDPVGMWLALSADLHQMAMRHYDPANPQATHSLGQMAEFALSALSNTILDKSFMGSVVRTANALSRSGGSGIQNATEQFVESNMGKLIPFSGLLGTVAEGTDKTERSTTGDGWASIWDELKSRLPGLSESDAPKRDVLGRPVERYDGTSMYWNPFAGVPANASHMDGELAKLAANVHVAPKELDGLALNAKQADEYTVFSTAAPIFDGLTLPQYLQQLTGSRAWQQLGTTADGGVAARTRMVQRAIDEAYQVGKLRFEQANPNFRRALIQEYMTREAEMTPGAALPGSAQAR